MIIDFIIEDLMLNSYLQKNFHTLYNFERHHSALDYQTPAECYYPAMLLPYVA